MVNWERCAPEQIAAENSAAAQLSEDALKVPADGQAPGAAASKDKNIPGCGMPPFGGISKLEEVIDTQVIKSDGPMQFAVKDFAGKTLFSATTADAIRLDSTQLKKSAGPMFSGYQETLTFTEMNGEVKRIPLPTSHALTFGPAKK